MSNTDASGEKRVTGTSERREQIIQRLRQQEVCKLMIYRRCMVYLL